MQYEQTIDRNVIVVDDNPVFLKLAGLAFANGFCGFCTWHLHRFSEPEAALEYYASHRDSVDVVIVDEEMPTMSGLELIDAMRALGSCRVGALPVIIASLDPDRVPWVDGQSAIVAKPFMKEDIAVALCDSSPVCFTGKHPHAGVSSEKPKPPEQLLRTRRLDEKIQMVG